jgi:hypothetical protein
MCGRVRTRILEPEHRVGDLLAQVRSELRALAGPSGEQERRSQMIKTIRVYGRYCTSILTVAVFGANGG